MLYVCPINTARKQKLLKLCMGLLYKEIPLLLVRFTLIVDYISVLPTLMSFRIISVTRDHLQLQLASIVVLGLCVVGGFLFVSGDMETSTRISTRIRF